MIRFAHGLKNQTYDGMIYGKKVLIAVDQLLNTLCGRLAGRNPVLPLLAVEQGRRARLAPPHHRRAALLEGRGLPARLRGGAKKAAMPAGNEGGVTLKR